MDFHTLLCFKLLKSGYFFGINAYTYLSLNYSSLSKDDYLHYDLIRNRKLI